MSNRDEILNSEKSADELAEEMMSKYSEGGYNENGEVNEDKEKEETAGDDGTAGADGTGFADDGDSDDGGDDGTAGADDGDGDDGTDGANDDGDGDSVPELQAGEEAFDLFAKINELNNPDNLDVPKGMVPYRENKQTKFLTPDEYNKRFHMGSHFTKKMQEHKKQLKTAEKFEKAGITEEDMQILAALKSGKVEEAMKGMGKQYNLDSEKLSRGVVDLEDEHINEYSFDKTQSDYQVPESVKSYFSGMPTEYLDRYSEVSEYIPASVRAIIDGNQNLTTGFATDIASGKAEKILDHMHSSISHLSDFEQQLRLTNPESFFNLYGEGEKVLFDNSNTGAGEAGPQTATPIPGSQIDSSEKAARARLNQKQSVRSSKPQKRDTKKDHTSRIMNEDGYVDKHIQETYGF